MIVLKPCSSPLYIYNSNKSKIYFSTQIILAGKLALSASKNNCGFLSCSHRWAHNTWTTPLLGCPCQYLLANIVLFSCILIQLNFYRYTFTLLMKSRFTFYKNDFFYSAIIPFQYIFIMIKIEDLSGKNLKKNKKKHIFGKMSSALFNSMISIFNIVCFFLHEILCDTLYSW